MNSFQLLIEALAVRFLHITHYELDYRWQQSQRTLRHSVLWFVQQGSFQLEINQVSFRCKEGHILILPGDCVISSHAISDQIKLVSINFDAHISFVSHQSWAQLLNVPLLLEGDSIPIQSILTEMLGHARDTAPFVYLLQQSCLLRILYELLRKGITDDTSGAYSQLDKRIHMIIHYLHAHPNRMPEMKELAELVQLSESHVRKLFIKQTGQAPLHFVHHIKIEQAKKQLASTVKAISQISYELGIDNANYFSRLFKAKTGLTPLQYRQQYGLWLNE
ncbi:AraC family transcriptional regulator [Paenibacillus roseipurpureus]|uniref:AraC family transcriptional regulator n=1 Tax=Paenibacillus roseopurpureus TaxID=2918901 RepID=A0AA96LMP6_9BACL|nr:AraC family transcriptional regulator [Paenibacillus sp. MBLB1832]WNR42654.1 AraC family transcriptional regulator [Paenibacillus sp. MBLB1832]